MRNRARTNKLSSAKHLTLATARYLSAVAMLLMVKLAAAGQADRKWVEPGGQFARLTGQITQLNPRDDGYGNGFIVGPSGCHVLTNFHVAFGSHAHALNGATEMVDPVKVGHTVLFHFDADAKTGKFKRRLVAKVLDFGNYEIGTSRGFVGDIALLELEKCLGPSYGHLEFDQPPTGKRVPTGSLMTFASSRNAAGQNEVLGESSCKSREGTSVTGIFISDCGSVPGMSGSMVLEVGPDNVARLVGMTTGGGAIVRGEQVSKAIYIVQLNRFITSVPRPKW